MNTAAIDKSESVSKTIAFLKNLFITSDTSHIAVTGSEQEICDAANRRGLFDLSIDVVRRFIAEREHQNNTMRSAILQSENKTGMRTVDMFSKGIRVMDNTDPAYFSIR